MKLQTQERVAVSPIAQQPAIPSSRLQGGTSNGPSNVGWTKAFDAPQSSVSHQAGLHDNPLRNQSVRTASYQPPENSPSGLSVPPLNVPPAKGESNIEDSFFEPLPQNRPDERPSNNPFRQPVEQDPAPLSNDASSPAPLDLGNQPMEENGVPTEESQDEAPTPPSLQPPSNPFPSLNENEGESERQERMRAKEESLLLDCEEIREQALGDDIKRVSLDFAPSFGVGTTDSDKAIEKQEAFAKRAPYRSWRDWEGRLLTEAKLVDLRFNRVVLEDRQGQVKEFPIDNLSDPDHAYVAEVWQFPVTCSLRSLKMVPRDFACTVANYNASGLCHKPLYFEEVQLERYGHEIGPVLQPVVSTAHFFANIAVLPYKAGIHPPSECQYALGYYRPGNCAPWTVGPIPISLRGGLFQAAAVTGINFALP